MRRIVFGLGLLFGIGAPSASSAQENPQARDGFWIGFGFGAGSLTCGDCNGGAGGAGAFRIGGTLSQKLLVGAQVDVWVHTTTGTPSTVDNTSFGNVAAAVYYYPVETSGVYVMGGVGIASWTISHGNLTEQSSSGPGLTLGIGYDWRLTKGFALTPNAALVVANIDTYSDRKTLTALNVGLGFTWP